MLRLIPPRLHRAILPLAYRLRHRWRCWRGTPLRGCAVVVTDLDGAILLLRHSYGPQAWMLPGGGLGAREDPERGARRELQEELGLDIERLTFVCELSEQISGSPHTTFLFAAITDAHPRPDRREVCEARLFPPHSLPEPLGRLTRAQIAAWQARRPDHNSD